MKEDNKELEIVYFTLLKPLPSTPIGTQAVMVGLDELHIKGIIMPLRMAYDNPEWFYPVTMKEHQAECEKNTIRYLMDTYSKTREEAIEIMDKW
jgi:hypothetical protein